MTERTMTHLLRGVERVTLTRVDVAEGKGTGVDPVRIVSYWYHDDGKLLVRCDPHTSEQLADMADAISHRVGATVTARPRTPGIGAVVSY
jgi:hypothetical protein